MSTGHRDTPSHLPGAVHRRGPTPTRPWQMRVGFWLLIGIAAFFLATEHRAHLVAGLRWLPMLFLLACPLIHMFGHGGHGGHGGSRNHSPDAAAEVPPPSTGADKPVDQKATLPHSHGGDLP